MARSSHVSENDFFLRMWNLYICTLFTMSYLTLTNLRQNYFSEEKRVKSIIHYVKTIVSF